MFKNGVLIEDGSHTELVLKGGEYARQYDEQVVALTGALKELEVAKSAI